MGIGLGFDTGGTYTDAVLMDLSNGKVVRKAKALTTRDDLSIGIGNAVKNFDKSLFKDVVMVSLSSTLATNSVVEGKGCRVGLVSVGREFDGSIPVDAYAFVDGGHDLKGKEASPLDEDAVEAAVESFVGRVDGVAVTSYLSVRNPDHEVRVKKIVENRLDVPVVCGHELSSSLGFNERAVTSIMNARLIPIIKELITSVKAVMRDVDIKAPLLIVKGNGTIMGEEVASSRPIETILSGPAASMIGAKSLTGKEDAIVMDMGGTTTDIGILRNGQPRLEKEGAVIGGRRTRVLAAEISTSGIGGDSRIVANNGRLTLSASRVVPLCIAASRWPRLKDRLKAVSETVPRQTPESLGIDNVVLDSEFFVKVKTVGGENLSDDNRRFLDLVSEEPFSLREASAALGIHAFDFTVAKMEENGLIQRIGLTPTDLLHAERSYVQYDPEASSFGVAYAAKRLGVPPVEFIALAKQKVVEKLSQELLRKLFFEETRKLEIDSVGLDLMNKAISRKDGLDFRVRIGLNKPIIGIGAPVAAYFPQVAEIFGAELLLPEHSEVGNAIGAVTGSVAETLELLIRPRGSGSDNPPCTVFSALGKLDFDTISAALEYADTEGRAFVVEQAGKAGADYVDVKTDIKEKRYDVGGGLGAGNALLEIEVVLTAVGKPRQFHTAA
ncbi:MAG: hydantoinase/oxoprolinase family protein [Candidatus Methanoplasma sp.]|jgi:N-methylhydantoinase A/oxoprolinase/acetone carboxylase beta subunit|nr:hydantoinase/oxoprolinase family protein [Candidatus Methanoplasma sp.]